VGKRILTVSPENRGAFLWRENITGCTQHRPPVSGLRAGDYLSRVPSTRIRKSLLVLAVGISACVPFKRVPQQPVNTPDLPIATDIAADSLLVDVQRVDSTAIVELRYATPNNFTGAPLPGYEGNHAFLRDEAAIALAVANADLHGEGYALKIFDAYRPVRASEAMVAWAQRTGRTDLLRDGYIAARSRHNLGVAVDCTLIELASGREVPMGTPFDTFSAAAHTANARGGFAANRKRLRTAMERQGFLNYEKEWWHFSYDVEHPVRFDRVIR
jgi:D-alanyl-D-alanine dipeptidase